MADYLGDDEDESRWEQPPTRIAPPNAASPLPAMNLRGLPAPQGSTEDLEQRGFQSHMRPAPIAKPSPIEADQTAAQNEVSRLRSTGPGFSQIGNPYARKALGVLDTIGSIAAPAVASRIPGTTAHNQRLIGQQQARIATDQGEAQKEAQTEEAKGRTEQAEAEAEKANAETNALNNPEPKPKEEKWSVSKEFTDTDGTPLKIEENSGQFVRATDGKPPTGIKAAVTKPERPDTPEQQYIDKYQEQHPGATVIDAERAYKRDTATPEKPQRVLGVTPDNKVIEITPGMTLPEGTQTVGGEIKTQQGNAGAKADIDFANNYIKGGHFDGPHDEALIEKFFDMSKPSSGFRMTQPQIDMALHARSALQGLKARAEHLLSPDAPYLDDHQRAAIVQTMNDLEGARGGGGSKGGTAKDYGAAPQGKADGSTGTLPDGTKVVVKGGRIVAQ